MPCMPYMVVMGSNEPCQSLSGCPPIKCAPPRCPRSLPACCHIGLALTPAVKVRLLMRTTSPLEAPLRSGSCWCAWDWDYFLNTF